MAKIYFRTQIKLLPSIEAQAQSAKKGVFPVISSIVDNTIRKALNAHEENV